LTTAGGAIRCLRADAPRARGVPTAKSDMLTVLTSVRVANIALSVK
jgi:hypothetical protein